MAIVSAHGLYIYAEGKVLCSFKSSRLRSYDASVSENVYSSFFVRGYFVFFFFLSIFALELYKKM